MLLSLHHDAAIHPGRRRPAHASGRAPSTSKRLGLSAHRGGLAVHISTHGRQSSDEHDDPGWWPATRSPFGARGARPPGRDHGPRRHRHDLPRAPPAPPGPRPPATPSGCVGDGVAVVAETGVSTSRSPGRRDGRASTTPPSTGACGRRRSPTSSTTVAPRWCSVGDAGRRRRRHRHRHAQRAPRRRPRPPTPTPPTPSTTGRTTRSPTPARDASCCTPRARPGGRRRSSGLCRPGRGARHEPLRRRDVPATATAWPTMPSTSPRRRCITRRR